MGNAYITMLWTNDAKVHLSLSGNPVQYVWWLCESETRLVELIAKAEAVRLTAAAAAETNSCSPHHARPEIGCREEIGKYWYDRQFPLVFWDEQISFLSYIILKMCGFIDRTDSQPWAGQIPRDKSLPTCSWFHSHIVIIRTGQGCQINTDAFWGRLFTAQLCM
jgi:hypothetical protein